MKYIVTVCWLLLIASQALHAECRIPPGQYRGDWSGNIDYQLGIKSEWVSTDLIVRYLPWGGIPYISWSIRFKPEGGEEELYRLDSIKNLDCQELTLRLSKLRRLEESQIKNDSWAHYIIGQWYKRITLKGHYTKGNAVLEMEYDPATERLLSKGGDGRLVISNNYYGSFISLGQQSAGFALEKWQNFPTCSPILMQMSPIVIDAMLRVQEKGLSLAEKECEVQAICSLEPRIGCSDDFQAFTTHLLD
ncbi:MAG: hypothetical protein ACR2PT_15100 [Endozoicomonas sp.]